MVRRVDGALGAAVISVEGLVIEAVDRGGDAIEPDATLAEYGLAMRHLMNLDEVVELGELQLCTLEGQERTTLIRRLSASYLAALQVGSETLTGRAAFELRVAAPDLAKEL
jgi:predicted regulator of Ras-like GTPase activity (Roadblock/LC7/MglB family)